MLIMLKFTFFLVSLVLVRTWSFMIMSLILLCFFWFLLQGQYDLGVIHLMCVDYTSFFLILLSLIIVPLMFLTSQPIYTKFNYWEIFSALCISMLIFLLLSFGTSDFFMFYIFFESSLIPIFLLIMGWGYQPERVRASLYLLFYTLAASLPMLLVIFFLESNFGTVDYSLFLVFTVSPLVFVFLILAFLVKMPVYLMHLWLPKAHVEAPVAGSMILAGVLLKLGGYGLMRVFSGFYDTSVLFNSLLCALGAVGGILACFVCFRQVDSKSLIAYSSVAHMALVLLGLSFMSSYGWLGCYVVMLAHGLCSSGLFCLVGLCYDRLGSRSIFLMRGMLLVCPLFGLWWFLFSIFNMGAPPSLNLFGEILVFISSFNWFFFVSLLVGLISFFSAAYSLFLFSSTQHGKINFFVGTFGDVNCMEHFNLFSHFFPLILSVPLILELC